MVIFFVINEKERSEWEKKFHVPYGYYAQPYFKTEEGAIGYVNIHREEKRNELVVERWENGECEVVYQGGWYEVEQSNK
jgi:hypothetical protein